MCDAHLQAYSTKHLPYGKHLELNMHEIVKLNGIIEKDFSETKIEIVCLLHLTAVCQLYHVWKRFLLWSDPYIVLIEVSTHQSEMLFCHVAGILMSSEQVCFCSYSYESVESPSVVASLFTCYVSSVGLWICLIKFIIIACYDAFENLLRKELSKRN